ncbi:MAG: hypothetical protein LRZ84_14370 [Desertifilum sp.]|nr:hypothetical protein [Desertifilum sp.]
MSKSASASGDWIVGGVASGFFRDLDGDAILPDAVARAIPGFLKGRSPDGTSSAPIHLHHGFWNKFIQSAVAHLNLKAAEQLDLITGLALPLGKVTEMRVDKEGICHWKGVLSRANPIAKVVWGMLKENILRLGVSLGGKIHATRPGRDALGRPSNLITDIRIDELSVTPSPAFRLLEDEHSSNGAYIAALSKSLKKSMETPKPLPGSAQIFNSGSWGETKTGMSRGLLTPTAQPMTPSARGKIKLDPSQPATGIGGNQPKASRSSATGTIPLNDTNISVSTFVRDLSKAACAACAAKDMKKMASESMIQSLFQGAYGLASAYDSPPRSGVKPDAVIC